MTVMKGSVAISAGRPDISQGFPSLIFMFFANCVGKLVRFVALSYALLHFVIIMDHLLRFVQ